MKNNKNLINYLSEIGALGGSEEEITAGKIAWRRKYKRDWRSKNKKRKELRPGFTPQQFEEIGIRAKLYGLNPTSYVRELILSAQEYIDLIPCRDQLLYILQSISMAEIALAKNNNTIEAKALLQQAEETLLSYLNIKGRYDR